MYILKKGLDLKINKAKASEEIGVSRPYLTNVLNSKIQCTKTLAFCITKYIDNNAEIYDYFDRVS